MYLRKIPLVTSPGVGSVLDRVRAGQSRGEGSWMSPLGCAMPHIHPLAHPLPVYTPEQLSQPDLQPVGLLHNPSFPSSLQPGKPGQKGGEKKPFYKKPTCCSICCWPKDIFSNCATGICKGLYGKLWGWMSSCSPNLCANKLYFSQPLNNYSLMREQWEDVNLEKTCFY